MVRQKKPVHRVQMTEGKRNIIHQLLEEYDWSYVKKKYKLNVTNFPFFCNC